MSGGGAGGARRPASPPSRVSLPALSRHGSTTVHPIRIADAPRVRPPAGEGCRGARLPRPLPIGALALLLANDFVLKPAFHNAVTGKLSDFAGLFLFALCGFALFPHRRKLVVALTAVGFALWKSALSQPGIDGWNALGIFPIDRVVDATDLVALLILPIAWLYRPGLAKWSFGARRILGPVAAAACVLAFGASMHARRSRTGPRSRSMCFRWRRKICCRGFCGWGWETGSRRHRPGSGDSS